MKSFAQSIVETVRHPLLMLDEELRIAEANPRFYRIFGGSPATIEGQSLFELDEGRWNHPQLTRILEDFVSKYGDIEDYHFEYVGQSGTRWLTLNLSRVTREEDDRTRILLAIEDVTEARLARLNLERLNLELEVRVAERTAELETAVGELRDANRELQASNQELDAFCFSVSHDLRAPLRAVDGFSQELLEGYGDQLDEQGRHYLRRVRLGTQRMGHLIDDLLNLSRLTRTEMNRGRIDLTALAEGIVNDLLREFPDRKVAFIAQPGLKAWCDARLIRNVMENLLGNAWKFTGKTPNAVIELGRTEHDGHSVFFVKDNGAGFDPAYGHKLFGTFQRLHADRDFPGVGVGLAIVRRVIRRHDGEAWAEGSVGQGATFYFTLPEPDGET